MSSPRVPSPRLVMAAGCSLGCVVALSAPATALALGTPGAFDPTFNGGSPITTDFAQATPHSSGFSGLIVDSAGRLVVGGNATDGVGKTAALMARYGADGAPDTTFNATGSRVQQLGAVSSSNSNSPFSVAYRPFEFPGGGVGFPIYRIRSDGRIDQSALALGADGTPNLDFGSAGFASFEPVASPASINTSMATAAADGSVFVGGTYDSTASGAQRKLGLTRFTPQGQVATSFGSGGTIQLSFSDSTTDAGTYAGAMTTVPGNKLLLAGTTTATDGRQEMYIARVSAQNGSPDPTFGKGGSTTVDARSPGGSDSQGAALAIGPDNSIYEAGYGDDSDDRSAFAVVRYGPSGNPDPSWGTGGLRKIQLATGTDRQDRSSAQAIAVQADGKVLVVGSASHADYSQEGLIIRLRTDGTLDPTFGTNGVVRLQLSSAPTPSTSLGAAAIIGDRLYVAGSVSYGTASSRALLASVLLAPLPDPPPAPPAPTPTPTIAAAADTPGPATSLTIGTPSPRLPGALRVSATKLTLGKGGTVPVAVQCIGAGGCAGSLAIVSRTGKLVGPFKKKDRPAITFGSATYSVAGGASSSIAVKLSNSAKKAIAKGRLKVRLSLTPAGAATSLANATVSPPKPAKSKQR